MWPSRFQGMTQRSLKFRGRSAAFYFASLSSFYKSSYNFLTHFIRRVVILHLIISFILTQSIIPFPLIQIQEAVAQETPSAMTTASRGTGTDNCVAPCAVFFDAVGTDGAGGGTGVDVSAMGSAKPFHELDYTWNFGDPTAGTWSSGRQNADGSYPSKNTEKGAVAAHVFETPGNYIVTLTVKNQSGQTNTYTQTITVEDPDVVFAGDKTYCFSSRGGFNGCPSDVPAQN